MIGTLTTGEWIVAAGSAALLVAMLAPVLWLCWRFVEMSDTEVEQAILDSERFVELNERAHRAIDGRA